MSLNDKILYKLNSNVSLSLEEKQEISTILEEINLQQFELETQADELNEQKKALSKAKETYLNLFRDAPVAYVLTDFSGKIKMLNLKALTIFEESKEKIQNASIYDFISPNFFDEYYLHLQSAQKNNIAGIDTIFRISETKTKNIRIHTSVNENNEFMSALIDISEQIKNQKEIKSVNKKLNSINKDLNESIDRYKTFESITTNGLFIHENFKILDINPVIEKITGYTRKDLIGKDISHLIPQETLNEFAKVLKHGYSSPIIMKSLTKQKELKYYKVFGKDIVWGGKRVRAGVLHDITEQKDRELQLKMLSEVVEQSPFYILVTDKKGQIEYVNPAFTTITGYTFEEVKGKNPRILKSGKIKKQAYLNLWKTITQGKIWRGQFINKRKNGDELIENVIISSIKEDGKIAKFFAIKEDITFQKKAESERLKSARIIQATFNSSTESFILVDRNYSILFYNKQASNFIYNVWQRSINIETSIIDYSPENSKAFVEQNIIRAFSGEVIDLDRRVTFSDEQEKWFHFKYTPVYNKKNIIFAVSLTIANITLRKKTEHALNANKNYLKSIFNSINDLIFIHDKDGNFIDFKKPEHETLFIPKEQFIGKHYSQVLPHKITKATDKAVQAIKNGKTMCLFDYKLTVNGKDLWYNANISPILDAQNKFNGFIVLSRNITKRIESEILVKQSEQRYLALFEKAFIPITLVDKNGNIYQFNSAANKMLGYTQEEYKKLHISEIDIFDNPEAVRNRIKSIKQKGFATFETRHKHKSGRILDVIVNAASIVVNNEMYTLSSFHDITQLNEAKKELKNSETKLKEAQQLAQMGNWEFDLEKNILTWSDEIFRIFGLKPQEFEPTYDAFLNHIHPDDRDFVNDSYFNSIEERKSYEIDHRIVQQNGEVRFVKEKCSHEFDASGKALRSVGIVIDITNQKNSERRENETKEKFRFLSYTGTQFITLKSTEEILKYVGKQLIKLIPESVSVINTIENETVISKVDYFGTETSLSKMPLNNSQLEKVNLSFDVNLKETFPKYGFKLFSDNFPKRLITSGSGHNKLFLKAIEHYKYAYTIGLYVNEQLYAGVQLITQTKLKSDSIRFIEIFIQQAKTALQEKIDAEQIQKAKEAAERANRIKSEFIANMSHEFRTPMNAILGFSELMNQKIKEEGELKNYSQSIYKSGKALLNLINDILDLSKIEAGRIQIKPSTLNVNIFFDEIKQIFKLKANKKDLDFSIEIPYNFPKTIKIDEVRLRQILFNLTGNAIKFTEKGYVKVIINQYKTAGEKGKIDFSVLVKDTGIGIEASQIENIFEPFHQQENQNYKKYGGTGLGLSISKRLAEAMKGKIEVKSEPGKGSEFIVSFYGIEELSCEHKKAYEISSNIKFEKSKILIADDLESVREIIKGYLSAFHFEIFEASNGKELFEKTLAQKPDLIISDIVMPQLNGHEALKQIKKRDEFAKIPVIGITSSLIEKEFGKLFNSVIQKPILKEELLYRISKYLKYEIKSEPKKTKNILYEELETLNSTDFKVLKTALAELNQKLDKHLPYFEVNSLISIAEELINLANSYNINSLVSFAGKLKNATQNFNIDETKALCKTFNTFVNNTLK